VERWERKKGNDSGKGGELVGEGECWDGSDNKICPGFSEEKNATDGCCSLETERMGCKKDKKMGQRVEWMAMGTKWRGKSERKETTGAREKKKGGGRTAAREGNSSERASVGMVVTIGSALVLVTKKNAMEGCCSLETERTGVQERQKNMASRVDSDK